MSKQQPYPKINGKPADELTMEWRDGRVCVHAWGVYGSSSVLAGQPLKQFVNFYDSVEEAEEAYPAAKMSNPLTQPQNTFDHLSDEPDH